MVLLGARFKSFRPQKAPIHFCTVGKVASLRDHAWRFIELLNPDITRLLIRPLDRSEESALAFVIELDVPLADVHNCSRAGVADVPDQTATREDYVDFVVFAGYWIYQWCEPGFANTVDFKPTVAAVDIHFNML